MATKTIKLIIPDTIFKRAKRRALDEGRSFTDLVRSAVRRYDFPLRIDEGTMATSVPLDGEDLERLDAAASYWYTSRGGALAILLEAWFEEEEREAQGGR